MVKIKASDPGIPPNIRQHIFEPFSIKTPGKGTGLGLSITYGLVKKLDGEITASSEAGKGGTFEIRLPLKPNTVHLIFMNRYFNYHDLGFHPSSWAKRIVAHFTFYSAWITARFTFSNAFFENFIQHRLMKSFPGLRGE